MSSAEVTPCFLLSLRLDPRDHVGGRCVRHLNFTSCRSVSVLCCLQQAVPCARFNAVRLFSSFSKKEERPQAELPREHWKAAVGRKRAKVHTPTRTTTRAERANQHYFLVNHGASRSFETLFNDDDLRCVAGPRMFGPCLCNARGFSSVLDDNERQTA